MKKNVSAYLEFSFEKIKLLRRTDKGEIWLVEKKSTGELFVMKITKFVDLPYAELKNFQHELFAKIFYCAEDLNDTVVIEEFIQGEPLIEQLKRKNFLSEEEARKILLQMCDGLKVLHDAGIVHRDIKPSNLILQNEKIRLIDFDAARTFKADKNKDTTSLGTEGYAPPEQFGFGQTDPRSDIYSLGVTFKELLGENYHGYLQKILRKCMELDPKNRFQSVEELKFALLEKKSPPYKNFFAAIFIAVILIFIFQQTTDEEKVFESDKLQMESDKLKVESDKPQAEGEKNRAAEKSAPPANYQFPEIKIPSAEVQLPEPKNNFDSPPSNPAPNNINSLPQIEQSKENALAEYFLNGELVADWTNWAVKVYHIQKKDWANFVNWTIEMRIKNFSAALAQNPRVEVVSESTIGNEYHEKKIFVGNKNGSEIKFIIPLHQFNIKPKEPITIIQLQMTLLDGLGQATETRAVFEFSLMAVP